MQKPVLVIKLGSAVITKSNGTIDQTVIKKLAEEIAGLSNTYHIVLVSSGAVGSGKAFIKNYKGSLIERKAAAAIGNPILIQLYHKYFSKYGITVAQALCERHHFSNRAQFLQLKETFFEFWVNNILPVVNENDLVSNVELKFSDNDELATLIAIGFDAESLIICTSVGGFMNDEKKIIPFVEKIDNNILGYISEDKSTLGLGGMLSKLTFTRLATSVVSLVSSRFAGHFIFCNSNQPIPTFPVGRPPSHRASQCYMILIHKLTLCEEKSSPPGGFRWALKQHNIISMGS